MIVGDVQVESSRARLSMITNEDGNILDDTIVTNFGDIFMVVNGAVNIQIWHILTNI